MPSLLPTPEPGRAAAEKFVAEHLDGLFCDRPAGSDACRGGQTAADRALEAFDVAGYAGSRNEVWPAPRRGASGLSPYIRHGLLSLRRVWDHVGDGPRRDVEKFRDELCWQEFARHWYARLGTGTRAGVRNQLPGTRPGAGNWDRSMACMEMCLDELEDDGWLVNQSRMWLSSHWTIREQGLWTEGEDRFFTHLLDGSRAANRLGWQWTTAAGSAKSYGFSRWQVEKRAPGLCGQCDLANNCPIEEWPEDPELHKVEPNPDLRRAVDPTADAGPPQVWRSGEPDVVWLTGESLGIHDPALAANPGMPALFVFDQPLLQQLQLSAKRLVFLVETLAEIGAQRSIDIHLGRPSEILRSLRPAVTFAPVPGFERISAELELGELHPYPWLARPGGGTVTSFSAWRRNVRI